MARTGAGHAARQNFAPFLNERLKHLGFLVVDEVHPLDAESADFFLTEILPLAAAARAAGSSAGSAWTSAFATLPSPSATGETFATGSSAAGMAFGTVARATTTGSAFRARGARSVRGSWRF